MPPAVANMGGTYIENKIIFYGGYNNNGYSNDVYYVDL